MSNTRLLKSIAVKSADITGNKLACIPSMCGNLDSYDDVIFPPKKTGQAGAFAKALPQFLKSGFNPLDHQWEWSAIVAYPTMIEERGATLYSECEFHSDQASQDALTKCRERLAAGKDVGLSIGFSIKSGQYVYFESGLELLAFAKRGGWDLAFFDQVSIKAHNGPCCGILEIDELYEYSLTPSPANRSAQALAVKKNGAALGLKADGSRVTRGNTMTKKIKTICGAPALLLAGSDTAWNAKDAIQRLREHTGATTEPNEAFSKAFVLVDGPNDEFESYKLPIADVVNGELKAVPAALRSAANVLGGLSGAAFDVAETTHTSAKTFVEGYYAKMDGERVPWAADAAGVHLFKGQYLGEYIEYSMCMGAMQSAFWALQDECADCLLGYGAYGDMTEAEQFSCIGSMFEEHKMLCMTIFKAIMAGAGAEDAQAGSKSIKRQRTAILSLLGDGLTYTKHARAAVDAAQELAIRTKSRLEMREKSDRSLSEGDRNTLKEQLKAMETCVKDIESLIAQTEPKADAEKARILRAQFLRRKVAPVFPA